MTIGPHSLAGAASATLTSSYVWAFVFGFISHFILDMLPHLEPKSLANQAEDGTKTWSVWLYVFVVVEFGITALFFFLLKDKINFPILLTGVFGGLFPDLVVNNPFLQFLRNKPVFKYFFKFHDKIHLDLPPRFWYISLIVEVALIGGTIWYLLKF